MKAICLFAQIFGMKLLSAGAKKTLFMNVFVRSGCDEINLHLLGEEVAYLYSRIISHFNVSVLGKL